MVLTRLFHQTHIVSCQAPISIGDDSEPEADFALMTLAQMHECMHRGRQTMRPDLVIEFSDSSYAYDSNEKASLYALARIPEYWVLGLRPRRLEVRQNPGPESDGHFGHNYRLLRVLHADQSVALDFAPNIQVLISELMPPV